MVLWTSRNSVYAGVKHINVVKEQEQKCDLREKNIFCIWAKIVRKEEVAWKCPIECKILQKKKKWNWAFHLDLAAVFVLWISKSCRMFEISRKDVAFTFDKSFCVSLVIIYVKWTMRSEVFFSEIRESIPSRARWNLQSRPRMSATDWELMYISLHVWRPFADLFPVQSSQFIDCLKFWLV